MALTIEVELRAGRYETGGFDPRVPETVPSPFRLFCALVASAAAAEEDSGFDALRWLERQAPPLLHLPDVLDSSRDAAFVVNNATQHKPGSQTWPGRTNGRRQRAWVTFDAPRFVFSWPEADPDDAVTAVLQRLAAGVPYVGRVTSSARVRLGNGTAEGREGLTTYRPVTLRDPGVDVAVPYDGSVDALRDLHERGDRSWEAARFRRYADVVAAPDETAALHRSPLRRLVVFGFTPAASVAGRHLVKLTTALRAATMSRVAAIVGEGNLPAALHGHDPTIRHLAFLGLPFVGHRHSDGRLLGVAVALPDLDPADEATILAGLIGRDSSRQANRGEGLTDLTGVFRGPLSVEYRPLPRSPHAITEARWRGPLSGSRTWVTATPIMLDRYVRRGDDLASPVATALVTAGYPEPSDVTVTPGPLVPGGLAWQPMWRRHAGPNRPNRRVVHARVTFGEPVVGPVLAGSLRYLGVGLMAPEDDVS